MPEDQTKTEAPTDLNNLKRVYDAMTEIRRRTGSARLKLSEADQNDQNNDIVVAYRTTCAYWRLLKRTIENFESPAQAAD